MWRANGNQNPCTDLDKIVHTHSHLSKEGLGAVSTLAPHLPGPGRPETLIAEEHIFEAVYKTKPVKQVSN